MRSIDKTLEIQSREIMLPPEGGLENFINNMTFEPSLKYGEQIIPKFFVYKDHRKKIKSRISYTCRISSSYQQVTY